METTKVDNRIRNYFIVAKDNNDKHHGKKVKARFSELPGEVVVMRPGNRPAVFKKTEKLEKVEGWNLTEITYEYLGETHCHIFAHNPVH